MTDFIYEGFDELDEHGYISEMCEIQHFTDGRPSLCRPAFNLEACKAVGYPKGTVLVFLNKNGYDWEREQVNKILEEGALVTVALCRVDGWSSTYKFEEVEGEFNTVMFEKYHNG